MSEAKAGATPGTRALSDLKFRRVAGRVLVTNLFGRSVFLDDGEFQSLLAGRLPRTGRRWRELSENGFFTGSIDLPALLPELWSKDRYLWKGPELHIVVTTLRCNHKCLYCHSSVVGADRTEFDMPLETARRVVDFIYQSPGPRLAIEFQGGEPMLNWAAVRYICRYAWHRQAARGQRLNLLMTSNFSVMDDERLDFLMANRVGLCTSLDGPRELHDRNRIFLGGSGHATTERWLRRISDIAAAGGRAGIAYRHAPNALMTTTRYSLPHARAIVDEYRRLGQRTVFLRPLSPIGFARRVWDKIGYTPEEFLEFYAGALDYILERNLAGELLVERGAFLLLKKILRREDPGFVDLRSPSGGGLGVLGYNYNGDIYTGDEGRMLAQEGEEFFRLGNVAGTSYNAVAGGVVNRTCAMATELDSQPLCSQCTYQPYCGQCPVYNLQTQGSLAGRTPSNGRCRSFMGIFDLLFARLAEPRTRAVFESWLEEDRKAHAEAPAWG